jgi:glyoxylase-like metal-dependent hydrolase (beta-lactamase superfamily II)
MRAIDVRHLGREHVICAWQAGDVLIDPGPESCVETLLAELEDRAPKAILLTHIHFDHAGAAGALARLWPEAEIVVHELGAPHLADPERLVASARRLYGDRFDELWGEVVPIDPERLRVVQGGETVHGFRVAYTPGHARHHVCYLHEDSGWAFAGDVAGVRIHDTEYTLAPTPPPDIDVEAWHGSLDTLASWRPTALALTHFGEVTDSLEQVERVRSWLHRWAPRARDEEQGAWIGALHEEVHAALDDEHAAALLQASPPDQLHMGLRRYWQKRADAAA